MDFNVKSYEYNFVKKFLDFLGRKNTFRVERSMILEVYIPTFIYVAQINH